MIAAIYLENLQSPHPGLARFGCGYRWLAPPANFRGPFGTLQYAHFCRGLNLRPLRNSKRRRFVILSLSKDQFCGLSSEAPELILRQAQDDGLRKRGFSQKSQLVVRVAERSHRKLPDKAALSRCFLCLDRSFGQGTPTTQARLALSGPPRVCGPFLEMLYLSRQEKLACVISVAIQNRNVYIPSFRPVLNLHDNPLLRAKSWPRSPVIKWQKLVACIAALLSCLVPERQGRFEPANGTRIGWRRRDCPSLRLKARRASSFTFR